MNNGSGSKGRRMVSLHLKGRKERENEDLHLFRELHRRDKERTACLLLPVSDDLEHNNGNSPFYRIQSIRKDPGFELLSESNKNDYDWLKTPPATPLFPSLEMEATAPRMKVQKETPLVQPLSQPQASSNSEATRRSNGMEKSPTTKPKIPSRSITPSHRQRINSSIEPKITKRTTTPTPTPNQRTTQASADLTNKRSNNIKSIHLKENCTDYLTSNLSKGSTNTITAKPNSNPRSRTTSPIVRSTIASQIPEFSNETPPNLRSDRSSSVTRGRQLHQTAAATVQKAEAINPRRQSCSPSVTRGRKVEATQEINKGGSLSNDQRRSEATNILGSRMVERVMNARKANGIGNEERDTKPRARSGIGDIGFISKSSADKTTRQLVRRK